MPRLTLDGVRKHAKALGYQLDREGRSTFVLWNKEEDIPCGSLGEANYVLNNIAKKRKEGEECSTP